MLKRLLFFTLGLFLTSLIIPVCRADEVTAAMCKADTRLQTRVTLRSPHILIGELLERLSKQSGITLTADDWSTVGSDSVTVSFHNVSLSDAMNALWSLFSYQHAEWDWHRRPEVGRYTYTLTRPDYARFLAERLQGQVQTDFEAQAQKLFDALDMPPDQLKEAAKNSLLLRGLLDDGRVRPGMQILASLPAETLLSILQDHQGVSIPVSELSPEARKALNASWDWEDALGVGRHLPDGSIMPMPRADHVSVSVESDPNLIAPTVYIASGRGSGGYFGGAFMQDAWQQKMNAQWMQPGDSTDDPVSVRTLPTLSQKLPVTESPHALADYLLRFSEATQVPLIARVPHGLDEGTPLSTLSQVPATKTIKTFLTQAQQGPLLMDHKWRGGVLLLTCQNWFVGQSEGARLPWEEVKRLRAAEANGDGFLSLDDMAHAANVLNEAQMTALSEWFPVMANAAQWHDFLAFYDKTPEYHPRVLSAKGDDWQYPESLVNARLGIDALRATHPNLRLQIQQKQHMERTPPMHEILFVVRDDDGIHPIGGQGFGWEAHEYQTSLKVDEVTSTSAKKPSH